MNNTKNNLNKLVKIALLGAIAAILMLFEFPIFLSYDWLKMDLGDLPVLIGAFAYGPIAGVIIELLKIVINTMLSGTYSGFVGEFANFLFGVALVVPAAFIYHRNKSKKTAVIGMITGSILMEIIAIIININVLIPLYGLHFDAAENFAYATAGLIPFNTIKCVLVCVITFVLYKRLSVSVFKVDSGFTTNKKKITEEV